MSQSSETYELLSRGTESSAASKSTHKSLFKENIDDDFSPQSSPVPIPAQRTEGTKSWIKQKLQRQNLPQLVAEDEDDRPLLGSLPDIPNKGWRSGLLACIGIVFVVNVINIALTMYVGIKYGFSQGISVFFVGDCGSVSRGNTVIHIIINFLSTILLGGSNYAMQIVSSPTRDQVDRAHRRMKWLDIGVSSIRNLSNLSRRQAVLWFLLVISSLPLHIMFNSVSFSAITANNYEIAVVTPTFLNVSLSYPSDVPGYDFYSYFLPLATNGSMVRLEKEDCITNFSASYVTTHRNVVLIASNATIDSDSIDPRLASAGIVDISGIDINSQVSYSWICGDGWSEWPYRERTEVCTETIALENAGSWTYLTCSIDYCLVDSVEESCKLMLSLRIMAVVIIMTMIKLIVMILILRTTRSFPLVTIGDAVASFLQHPDPTTEGMCLVTRDTMKREYWNVGIVRAWYPVRRRWFHAASYRRWIICNSLCLVFLLLAVILYTKATASLGTTAISELWNIGWGAVDPASFLNLWTFDQGSLISAIVIANLPQLIFSFLYVLCNGLFTCMTEAWEWSFFGVSRHNLRVSHPKAGQGSTRYLQLPYRFSLPLLAVSGVMHWLISESIFVAYVQVTESDGSHNDRDGPIVRLCYSTIVIFVAIMVGSCFLLTMNLVGYLGNLASAIPLVGSSSAAISAACHPPEKDVDAAFKAVMWGVVEVDGERSDIEHCSLSSFDVSSPQEGKLYA